MISMFLTICLWAFKHLFFCPNVTCIVFINGQSENTQVSYHSPNGAPSAIKDGTSADETLIQGQRIQL